MPFCLLWKSEPWADSRGPPRALQFRSGRTSRDPGASIDRVKYGTEGGADHQIIMTVTRGNGPPEHIPWTVHDLESRRPELRMMEARDLIVIVCVLLEPASIDQAEEVPSEFALAGAREDERDNLDRRFRRDLSPAERRLEK